MSSKQISTRTRILKSTWALLEDGSGSAVRMSDIAKAAKISRQALYLHFPNRAELLVATTHYLDEIYDVEAKLVASRTAKAGADRLNAWIEVWGNYIPKIYGIATALMAMQDNDAEAHAAWEDRTQAVRHGCAAAISALQMDNLLSPSLSEKEATDILWTLLSVRNWEQLRMGCEWSQDRYIEVTQAIAARMLIAD